MSVNNTGGTARAYHAQSVSPSDQPQKASAANRAAHLPRPSSPRPPQGGILVNGKGKAFSFTSPKLLKEMGKIAQNAPKSGQRVMAFNSSVAYMPTAGLSGNRSGKILEHVQAGKTVYDNIRKGVAGSATPKDMANLMWFLQAHASAKAGASSGADGNRMFANGDITIEDPDGNLERYLLSSVDSHRLPPGDGDTESAVVDIRNQETPNNSRSMIFSRPAETDAKSSVLSIRMSPCYCGRIAREDGVSAGQHAMRGVKRFFTNAGEVIAQGWRRMTGKSGARGAVETANNRAEVPADIKTGWKKMERSLDKLQIDAASSKEAAAIKAQLKKDLFRGDPLGKGGLKQMRANIGTALAGLENRGARSHQMEGILKDFDAKLARHGDHSDIRTGNEVILTAGELDEAVSIAPIRKWAEGKTVEATGVLSRDEQDAMLSELRNQWETDNSAGPRGVAVFPTSYTIVDERPGGSAVRSSHALENYSDGDDIRDFNRISYSESVLTDLETLSGKRDEEAAKVADLLNSTAENLCASLGKKVNDYLNATAGVNMDMTLAPEQADNTGTNKWERPDTGAYTIARQPDRKDGSQVYNISYRMETRSPGVYDIASEATGRVSLRDDTRVDIGGSVQVAIDPKGNMMAIMLEAPQYSFKLV